VDFRLDVYHHFDFAASVTAKLDQILTQIGTLMATVTDVKAKIDALTAKVTAEETVIDSVVTLLNGLTAIIADLKAQLTAAGTDPVALQAVSDQLDALGAKIDADKTKLGDAVTADTPAA
jgi:chromosome segregation ATPase